MTLWMHHVCDWAVDQCFTAKAPGKPEKVERQIKAGNCIETQEENPSQWERFHRDNELKHFEKWWKAKEKVKTHGPKQEQ